MYRAYEIWEAYTAFVAEGVFALLGKTEDWGLPPLVTVALLLLPMIAVDVFLPRWVSVGLLLTIAFPTAWHVGSMLLFYFLRVRNNKRTSK